MEDKKYLQFMKEISFLLEQHNITYHFIGTSSLWLQNVEIHHLNTAYIEVQWDVLDQTYELFQSMKCTEIEKNETTACYKVIFDSFTIQIVCHYNTTIKTEPYRIQIEKGNQLFWCISLYKYIYYDHSLIQHTNSIHYYLENKQQIMTKQNEEAWNQNNYIALVNRYGSPDNVAEKIRQNPKWRLHPFHQYISPLKNKKVLHLMGSNGIKAVAMSLLGADVTVVDFSRENEVFAKSIAKAANVNLTYVVSDVLSFPIEQYRESFDVVVMELGVLHYLIDLIPLMKKINQLLRQNGRFVLHEFHPISTKLITSTGKKHKVTGNYFEPSIEKNAVAFTKHMPDEEKMKLSQVLQRKWTLGELITSVGQANLFIETLEEEPNHKLTDIGLPKTFTLVSKKL